METKVIPIHSQTGSIVNVPYQPYDNVSIITKTLSKLINVPSSLIRLIYRDRPLQKFTSVDKILPDTESAIIYQIMTASNEKPVQFPTNNVDRFFDTLNDVKEAFGTRDVIAISQAIYSKEHKHPELQRDSDPPDFPELMKQVQELGYDPVRSANALRRARFRVNTAASFLIDGEDRKQEILEIADMVEEIVNPGYKKKKEDLTELLDILFCPDNIEEEEEDVGDDNEEPEMEEEEEIVDIDDNYMPPRPNLQGQISLGHLWPPPPVSITVSPPHAPILQHNPRLRQSSPFNTLRTPPQSLLPHRSPAPRRKMHAAVSIVSTPNRLAQTLPATTHKQQIPRSILPPLR